MRAAYLVAVIFAAGLVGGAIAAWVITTPKPAFARDARRRPTDRVIRPRES